MLRKIVDFVKKILWTEPMVSTVNTLKDAMRDLEVARNHFENCDPEFITTAIFELNAAESRLDAARRCGVKPFYYPTYKCRFCERKFNDGHPYCNLEDAKNNLAGLMAFRPIHYCDGGHIGIGYFTGLERVDKDE